jgi:hypothetical protein
MQSEHADVKRRHQRTACVTTLALGVAAAAWAAAGAAAYTAATGGQYTAIQNAVHNQWRLELPNQCPADIGGPTVFHLNWARISSIYPEYAHASVQDDSCTYTVGYVLRRPNMHSNQWHVITRQLDSAQSCSELRPVPGPVLNEFGIEGNTGGEGELHLCGPTTGRPWCDQFGVAYAVNTTCAIERRVAGLYGEQCILKTYRGGPLPACRRTLIGFKCTPSGDVYAVINCVDGRRRVGLHLAE